MALEMAFVLYRLGYSLRVQDRHSLLDRDHRSLHLLEEAQAQRLVVRDLHVLYLLVGDSLAHHEWVEEGHHPVEFVALAASLPDIQYSSCCRGYCCRLELGRQSYWWIASCGLRH